MCSYFRDLLAGLLCGYCAEGFAIELNECALCSSNNDNGTMSIIASVVGITLAFFVLFFIGWRPVLVDNVIHRGYDKMVVVLSAYVQTFLRWFSTGEAAGTANFLKDTNIRKHLPQAVKILIGLSLHYSSFPHT